MNRSHLSSVRSAKPRSGFTLVEILVAITIIGILAAFLAPVTINALQRARETTVVVEMRNMDVALETFKTEHGFYPPTLSGLSGPVELLRYVNRLSPQHAERSPSGVTGGGSLAGGQRTRLEHWWIELGQYMDAESSLVFWLSGVCTNKQFPITGGVAMGSSGWDAGGTPNLAAHGYGTDGIARDIKFDFKTSQIFGDDADETVTDNGAALPGHLAGLGLILEYRQGPGNKSGKTVSKSGSGSTASATVDYLYKYVDAGSYGTIGAAGEAYNDGTSFINPNSYQLITFGIDGLPGIPGNPLGIEAGIVVDPYGATGATNFDNYFGPWGADNICNFAEGRLSKWVTENN